MFWRKVYIKWIVLITDIGLKCNGMSLEFIVSIYIILV